MKVLGIDPGYGRCGMAVVEKASGKEVLLYSTCVETSVTADFPSRLAQVSDACGRLIEQFKPDCMALEKLYITKNQKTAMQVAEVRGALQERAAQAALPVAEYTPGEIKSAVASSGRADKKQIAAMLHMLIKIERPIKHDDEYDAIAIALTHLAHAR
jgi:crossover junction endodeoxyribonuclease RuvC